MRHSGWKRWVIGAAAGLATWQASAQVVGTEPADLASSDPTPPTFVAEGAGEAESTQAFSRAFRNQRAPFESDHAFDGFTGPFSNPVQFKDPRSLTEARGIFIAAWSDPAMPLGDTTAQVYALQLRAAVTERLQVFADKDGIVRLNPGVGASQTGLANLAAGAKYAFYRDPDTQSIASAVVQYEAPTGYANIFQNQGSGLLAGYIVMGQEFAGDTHAIVQFGQNGAMNVQNAGYFLTLSLIHI